jgi:ribulose-phosphate 3-epimerase
MLSASLVCADMMNIQGEILKLEKGGIDYIHFDVMDNQFVPRFGLHPEILQSIKKNTKIPVDVHLMVNNPENAIPAFIQAGADIIVFHIESTPHAHRLIRQIRNAGIKAGIAINPATNLSVLDYLLEDIDMVMLMAINPGILGHKLIPEMMQKISDLKTKLKNHKNIIIAIDGGVSFDSAQEMVKRGASFLVCGTSTIFKPEGDVDVKIVELNKLLTKANKK